MHGESSKIVLECQRPSGISLLRKKGRELSDTHECDSCGVVSFDGNSCSCVDRQFREPGILENGIGDADCPRQIFTPSFIEIIRVSVVPPSKYGENPGLNCRQEE